MPRMNSTNVPKSTCTLPLTYRRAARRVHEHSEVLSWQTDCMTASSRKPKFHLNTNAGIVLTLQCRVLTLPLSAQPPYKFPSLLLRLHIPKPSLAGNYMHFNIDNKQDLTSKYSAAMGFEIWTSNAFISRWYRIIGFFTRSFKIVCPLCKATKRITEECEISINIGSQKLSQLEKNVQYIYLFKRLEIGKVLKKSILKEKEKVPVFSITRMKIKVLELLLQVVQVIWKENYTESIPALSSLCNDENLSHTTKSKSKF